MDDESSPDVSPIFDSLDIDLFVKVFANTAFSPFFVMLIPTFYVFQGAKFTDSIVVLSACYYVFVALFWAVKWYSRLYDNQGNLLYAPPRFDWGEQIIVVTGGASGVGELLANTLAVRNVTVVVLDVKPIQTENFNIAYYKCDVSKWEEVEAVSKKIIEEIGQPTVLINNAGVVQGKLILDLSPEDIQQTFGVNTLAHFWTLKAFLPGMIEKKKGHIASPSLGALNRVTMASVMGIQGAAQMTDYCASKAALINLHRSLRAELNKRYKCPAIRTTLIVPGHIYTPLFSTLIQPQQFFFPTLHPITIVKRVIAALDETHSQTIYLPFYTHFAPALHLLPGFVSDFASWISNADFAMKDFVKMSGRRSEEGPAPPIEFDNGFPKRD
ncbi:retinal short-chain dehydrogenase reductase [Mycena sp. CBHHK59/15]|nr:retinal short-chain dehydrogenase reductase [Mycena sp. CBHHK59/15]